MLEVRLAVVSAQLKCTRGTSWGNVHMLATYTSAQAGVRHKHTHTHTLTSLSEAPAVLVVLDVMVSVVLVVTTDVVAWS